MKLQHHIKLLRTTALSYQRLRHNRCLGYKQVRFSETSTITRSLHQGSSSVDPTLGNKITSLIGQLDRGVVLDMTFGDGHHTCRVLEKFPQARVIALDRDKQSYNLALQLQAEKYENRLMPILGKISELDSLVNVKNSESCVSNNLDVVLLDPGVSDIQKSDVKRGFQYNAEAPLDMRMDEDCDISVYEVLKHTDEDDLHRILKFYGGERQARKIARSVIESRYELRPMFTTRHLINVIARVLGKSYSTGCVFQGLRMFVNNELNELNYGLKLAHHYLKKGGKLITISHNPEEDELIINHLLGKDIVPQADQYGDKKESVSSMELFSTQELKDYVPILWQPLTTSPIIPSIEEQEENPALRQVRIRVAKKL